MATRKASSTKQALVPAADAAAAETVIADTLARAGVEARATLRESLTSSVTTAWGVAWDEPMIARDLLQNFFDANRQALDQVVTRTWDGGVQVSAPATFQLDRLFFLGSEKDTEDVGQYGEGFKAAAICLLRDHGVQPVVLSGNRGVLLRVAPQYVGDTALRPVVYQFFELVPAVSGTVLLLPTRSPKLVKALCSGMDDFLHAGNPALGELIFETDDLALHHARDGNGHLFYRHLRRCTVPGYPLVWVVRSPIATVERRIGQDRDRNAFGDVVRGLYLRGFLQMAMRRHWHGWTKACLAIVQAGQPHWERGHPILAELAAQLRGYRGDSQRRHLAPLFASTHYARAGQTFADAARQLEIEGQEQTWTAAGRVALPGYFSHLGAEDAPSALQRRAKAALEAARRSGCRPPTPAERAGLDVLSRLMHDFAPDIATVFTRRQCRYTVGNDDSLLGQLRRDRGYRSTEVYLDASVFVADLGHAAAVFLHEHAHIFGWDGSRGFSDALTELLETVVREHRELSRIEPMWDLAVEQVRQERSTATEANPAPDATEAWLTGLTEDKLRALLAAVAPSALRTARGRIEQGN